MIVFLNICITKLSFSWLSFDFISIVLFQKFQSSLILSSNNAESFRSHEMSNSWETAWHWCHCKHDIFFLIVIGWWNSARYNPSKLRIDDMKIILYFLAFVQDNVIIIIIANQQSKSVCFFIFISRHNDVVTTLLHRRYPTSLWRHHIVAMETSDDVAKSTSLQRLFKRRDIETLQRHCFCNVIWQFHYNYMATFSTSLQYCYSIRLKKHFRLYITTATSLLS